MSPDQPRARAGRGATRGTMTAAMTDAPPPSGPGASAEGAAARDAHREALDAGRAAHPAIALPAGGFARYLDGRHPGAHAADLYLCFACLGGDAHALAALDAALVSAVEGPLVRLGLPRHEREEVTQSLRARLLVGDERGPRLSDYVGKGSLAGWLRASAVNAGLNRQREQARARVVDDEGAWLTSPSPDDDPELAALKRSCGAAFRQAFGEAIAGLSPRSRLLLRQHLLDGLSHEQLGALHGVHAVTAFRWLRDARAEVTAATRQRLGAALRLRPAELDSMLRLLESQLDASVSRLLSAPG